MADRLEAVRQIRIQDPTLSYSQIADRLEKWRPELMPSKGRQTRKNLIARAVKEIEAQDEGLLVVSLPEAEEARRIFVEEIETIRLEALKKGDLQRAESASVRKAKACGADIDRPIRIETVKPGMALDGVEQPALAAFVAGLSEADRYAVQMAFPDLDIGGKEQEAN